MKVAIIGAGPMAKIIAEKAGSLGGGNILFCMGTGRCGQGCGGSFCGHLDF